MKVFLRLLAPVLFLAVLCPNSLFAADAGRTECGEYDFELPPGFELRTITVDGPDFNKTLNLNEPFAQKDLLAATVTCLREKKTAYRSFALPHKEKINFLTGARLSAVPMHISATENSRHDNIWIKFSLLEERSTNARVINGRERFMVAIETDAAGEDWHTVLLISDFRRFDGFFDADEYKSDVTGVAVRVLESLRKRLP